MRIGVFLGSFDPIHIDHLKVIGKTINKGILDVLYVVPAVHNPWKEHEPAPYNVRCEMVRLAVEPFNTQQKRAVITSEIEQHISHKHGGKQSVYSFETLNEIRLMHKPTDEFYIVCGDDVKDSIHKWKNYQEDIKPYWNLLSFGRPDGTCSSTQIREMVAENKEIYPLVPQSVRGLIIKYSLYGCNKL